MWYITTYEPVALISLKMATATSTGGKSLLLPTPFAYKMALLGVALSGAGLEQGMALWPHIRDADVAVRGPEQIVANNTFAKIMKPARGKAELDPDTGLIESMNHTIGFREYVQWHGDCRLAIRLPDKNEIDWKQWLTSIHYIGKRGGLLQAVDSFQSATEPDATFTYLTQSHRAFRLDGTLQLMDDCAEDVTFDQVNIYSSKSMRLGKDRILRHVIIPYRQVRSSRGYTLYERIDDTEESAVDTI
ncbi:MAG: hypothetical protein KDD92_20370 [Caldilineaceae bacterium]|nr:hypothetical protein [Caldilineaceae bacterium]